MAEKQTTRKAGDRDGAASTKRTPPQTQKPRTTEVPGRPEADHEPRREKAYGPGGADPESARVSPSSRQDATPIDEPTSNIDDPPIPGEPPGAERTAEGADTKPL
ncbi:MAG TPA: hypothetical protein VFF69_13910 [Phycisphaerales bacterium]|nr:hypothetical protein [Phycisphaerales bacterium]